MKNITVKDIMSTDYAKVSTDMPVVEASMELIKKEVLGGPVVDNNNLLLGWISEQECLQVITKVVYHNERVAPVNDILQVDVLTVAEDQSVLSLAEKMNSAQPKNYPVVDHSNKVIGVITRRRVLESMLGLI